MDRLNIAPDPAAPADVSKTAPPSSRSADPADEFFRILRSEWKVVVMVAIIATIASAVMVLLQPKRYRAASIAAVAPIAGTLTPNEAFRGVEVLSTRTLVGTIAALAPPTVRNGSATYRINGAVLPNTNLVRIEAEGADPRGAAEAANQVVADIAGQTRTLFKYYSLNPVTAAHAPSHPSAPRTGRMIASGVVLGIVLGLAAAYVTDRRRRTA